MPADRTVLPNGFIDDCGTQPRRSRSTMKKIIHVRIVKGEKQYLAESLDLPVVTQAKTLDELAENLREAISLHLRGEDPAELGLAENPPVVVSFALDPLVHPTLSSPRPNRPLMLAARRSARHFESVTYADPTAKP